MARDILAPQFPWCTVILCSLCMIMHLMVLFGNYLTAASINAIGASSNGWSNLGLDMAETFTVEIDNVMANMTQMLTDGIEQIAALEEMLDFVIGVMGKQTDQSLLQVSLLEEQRLQDPNMSMNDTDFAASAADALENFPVPLPDGLKKVVEIVAGGMGAAMAAGGDPIATIKAIMDLLLGSCMQQVHDALDMFLDILEPALLKVGDWYLKFGDKLQAGIEQFATTIDVVEKLLDQIMAQSGAGGENAEDMEYNTYNLFAISNKDVGISVQDLQDVAAIYSITPLQGSKAEDIHGKYDANQDAVIDKNEYSLLVQDDTLPGVMAVVLRSYAKRLSQVSGMVGGAKMRDEVANSVVKYLQLVAAKNLTKVEWIADRLTNNSLPMAFTADVLRNLALARDDPEVLTTSDVGATVVGIMTEINAGTTREAAELMSDTEFWVSEGFDPADQPICVERVSKWTAASLIQSGSWVSLKKLHEVVGVGQSPELSLLANSRSAGTEKVIEMTGAMARSTAERNRARFFQQRHERLLARHEALMSSTSSRYLFDTLLGGQLALQDDPMAAQALNSGVPAVPETLEFAKFLSWNATDSAAQWQSMCFNYSGMSSTPADAFATQIEGMVKKVQGFLSMLEDYAGPEGMDRLRNKTHGFVEDATVELENVIIGQLNKSMSLLEIQRQQPNRELALLELESRFKAETYEVQPAPGSGTWTQLVTMLQQVQAILPVCIDNLKVARKEVSVVSKTLDSVFDTFRKQGLPIFKKIAEYYILIWIMYFVLLSAFTLGILYYGFWASGYMGGPQPYDDNEEWEPPQSCWERCKTCCAGCYYWCCWCTSGECFFWSCLLFGQLFVLIIFIVSLVLTIISGLKMFVATGCAAIYVLGDEKACTETLKMIQNWITTFDAGAPELQIAQVCVDKDLMTCAVIANKLKTSAIFTIIGAIVASVLSFQLLIESAILHERARMRRLIASVRMGENVKAEDI